MYKAEECILKYIIRTNHFQITVSVHKYNAGANLYFNLGGAHAVW
jgi:hypothetical protein